MAVSAKLRLSDPRRSCEQLGSGNASNGGVVHRVTRVTTNIRQCWPSVTILPLESYVAPLPVRRDLTGLVQLAIVLALSGMASFFGALDARQRTG
jgi:hypothetical protein